MKRSVVMTVPVSVTTGVAVDVSDLYNIVVSIASIGTATYKVMVSFDGGTSFTQYGASLTADGNVVVPDACSQVRIDCSAFTSGTPKGAMGGVKGGWR